MKDESYYKQLLVNADNLDHYECIPYTDWKLVFNRVKSFEERLRQKIDIYFFDTDSAIQDATFHTWIRIRRLPVRIGIDIKFSNFGDLVSIFNEDCLAEEERDYILKLFEEFKYVYIPEEIVMQPCVRNIEGFVVDKEYTWHSRFFDFV